jgi:putative hemolysin
MDSLLYLVLVVCLLFSGFFSAAEVAIVSLGRPQLRRMVKEGRRGSGCLQRLKKDQRRTIVTVLIGNNIVNILASTIAAAIAIETYGELGVGIATGVMAFLLLIFGEIMPKSFAVSNQERFSLFAAPIMYYVAKLLFPLVQFFDFFARLVSKSEKHPFSEKDIRAMVELGVEEKVLEPQEQKLIERVLKFNDVQVREIMVPLKKFVSLGADWSIEEASKIAVRHGYSRFPVHEDEESDIVGIARSKDLLLEFSRDKEGRSVRETMLPVLKVSGTELIDDVFRLFQKTHNHMGIVTDPWGNVMGLVTLEDMLEEIVGEFESDGEREQSGHA